MAKNFIIFDHRSVAAPKRITTSKDLNTTACPGMNTEFKILGFQTVCSSGRPQPKSGNLKVIPKDLLSCLCIIQKEKKIQDPRMMAANILE